VLSLLVSFRPLSRVCGAMLLAAWLHCRTGC
jgi:hypothetical protein